MQLCKPWHKRFRPSPPLQLLFTPPLLIANRARQIVRTISLLLLLSLLKQKRSTFYISFICFRGSLNKFFSYCNGLKPDLNKHFTDDCVGATSSKREKLHQLIASVNSLNSVLKCSWETSQKLLVFFEIKFLDNDHAYLLTCTTKQQILI